MHALRRLAARRLAPRAPAPALGSAAFALAVAFGGAAAVAGCGGGVTVAAGSGGGTATSSTTGGHGGAPATTSTASQGGAMTSAVTGTDVGGGSSVGGQGGRGGHGGAGGAGVGGLGGHGGAGGFVVGPLVDVLTNHNDAARTGQNLQETELAPGNVDVKHFGRVFTRSVDDQIYTQPLVLTGVAIPGKGTHDVVYVATMSDTVYAFDADDPAQPDPLWSVSFVDNANGVFPVTNKDVGQNCGTYQDISGNIGILGTPVIDRASGTLWVVAKTKEGQSAQQVYRLHALDVATGAEKPNSPVALTASVPGMGDGSTNGTLTFNPVTANQRPALLLSGGLVYVAFSSYCDTGPYHGWVLSYDAVSLQQKGVYNDTPNGADGGIWMSGQGLAADAAGDLYFEAGNGTFDGDQMGGADLGCSLIKLGPDLGLLDWFTPFNVTQLNNADLDLGSAGAMVLPGANLVLGGSKGGWLYVLDRGNLGHFNAAADSQIVQSFQVTGGEVHGSPIAWDVPGAPMVYVWGANDYLHSYRLTGGLLAPVGQSQAPAPDGSPGGVLSLSANGSMAGTGIVWATHTVSGDANQQVLPGVLQAFDASDVSKLLWDSQMDAARDAFGNLAKFTPPTVANGKVYVSTFSNQLVVYGHSSFNGPCFNGVQDPGETGIDCGGMCPPCVPHAVACSGNDAMFVGGVLTCDLGQPHTVVGMGLSVGCNDGETGTFTVDFDQPPQVLVNGACNGSFMINNVASQHATLTMTSGGGADMHISVQSWSLDVF